MDICLELIVRLAPSALVLIPLPRVIRHYALEYYPRAGTSYFMHNLKLLLTA